MCNNKEKRLPRGLRNKNPGNIRNSKNKYLGEVQPSQDSVFKQFQSIDYGYRAMFVLLESYRRRYSIDTLRGIVTRWAPPLENDTESYIRFVAARSEVDPDAVLPPRDVRLRAIAEAMSRFERGHEPSPAQLDALDRGWKLFLGDYGK